MQAYRPTFLFNPTFYKRNFAPFLQLQAGKGRFMLSVKGLYGLNDITQNNGGNANYEFDMRTMRMQAGITFYPALIRKKATNTEKQ